MYNLIYLDIDGVLNRHNYSSECDSCTIEPTLMKRLNRICVATDAKIVLTSAWRYYVHNGDMTFRGLQLLFGTHGLHKDRLIGITRMDDGPIVTKNGMTYPETDRNQQIYDWFRDNPLVACFTRRYLILDDIDFFPIKLEERRFRKFIQTDPKVGLTDDHVIEAIDWLS